MPQCFVRRGWPGAAPHDDSRRRGARLMDRCILEFAELLRSNGLRVSLSECIDAFRVLTLVELDDRESLKDALRTAMVKRALD